ncbi:MAG: hypothetical protein ACPGU3_06540, partial [Litorivicinus sp.]
GGNATVQLQGARVNATGDVMASAADLNLSGAQVTATNATLISSAQHDLSNANLRTSQDLNLAGVGGIQGSVDTQISSGGDIVITLQSAAGTDNRISFVAPITAGGDFTIVGGDGNDVFDFEGFDLQYGGSVRVDGGSGADSIAHLFSLGAIKTGIEQSLVTGQPTADSGGSNEPAAQLAAAEATVFDALEAQFELTRPQTQVFSFDEVMLALATPAPIQPTLPTLDDLSRVIGELEVLQQSGNAVDLDVASLFEAVRPSGTDLPEVVPTIEPANDGESFESLDALLDYLRALQAEVGTEQVPEELEPQDDDTDVDENAAEESDGDETVAAIAAQAGWAFVAAKRKNSKDSCE